MFVPAHLKSVKLCVAFNILPFSVLPLITLAMLVRRLLAGGRD